MFPKTIVAGRPEMEPQPRTDSLIACTIAKLCVKQESTHITLWRRPCWRRSARHPIAARPRKPSGPEPARLRYFGPFATGRPRSRIHSLQEPAYSLAPESPRDFQREQVCGKPSRPSRTWQSRAVPGALRQGRLPAAAKLVRRQKLSLRVDVARERMVMRPGDVTRKPGRSFHSRRRNGPRHARPPTPTFPPASSPAASRRSSSAVPTTASCDGRSANTRASRLLSVVSNRQPRLLPRGRTRHSIRLPAGALPSVATTTTARRMRHSPGRRRLPVPFRRCPTRQTHLLVVPWRATDAGRSTA